METNGQDTTVAQAVRGDRQAFARLYDAYSRKIYDYVFYRVRHKEAAEDLTSAIFMKALDRIATFDASRGYFQAWLYTIARNTVFDHWRTMRITEDLSEAEVTLAGPDNVAGNADARMQIERVEKYLRSLPPEQRDIILLRVWDDLPYAQIAEIVGKSEASCKMAVSRGLSRLQKELGAAIAVLLVLINL